MIKNRTKFSHKYFQIFYSLHRQKNKKGKLITVKNFSASKYLRLIIQGYEFKSKTSNTFLFFFFIDFQKIKSIFKKKTFLGITS